MKHFTFKSVLFGLLFTAAAGLLSASVVLDPIKPVERINWINADTGNGSPGDTTNGGIRTPGPGH